MTNDAGPEFQDTKRAFIARQAERRREQLAAWSSMAAEEAADLHAMNHELLQIYATMSSTPERQQAHLRVQAAALRTRRGAARGLMNQTLAAEVQRLDEEIVRYQAAISRATSENERAVLTAQNETLRRSRAAAEQQLAASLDAGLQERWRDITALEAIAAHYGTGVTEAATSLTCQAVQFAMVNLPLFGGALQLRLPGAAVGSSLLDMDIIAALEPPQLRAVVEGLLAALNRLAERGGAPPEPGVAAPPTDSDEALGFAMPGVRHYSVRSVLIVAAEPLPVLLPSQARAALGCGGDRMVIVGRRSLPRPILLDDTSR